MNYTWIKFLNSILKMPGAKVNRSQFLNKTFNGLGLSEEEMRICINESPAKVIDAAILDAKAKSIINSHTAKVTAISAAAGMPGGLAMLATIPADLANYYFHVVSVGQKLGYIYGFPDMVDDNGNLTDDGNIMLTAFIGVMNNVRVANELIRHLAVALSKRVTEKTAARVAENILSKQIVAQSVEVIAKKLGTRITSKTAGRSISKAIPIVSGLICGGVTYATFKPQSRRLHSSLKELVNKNPDISSSSN